MIKSPITNYQLPITKGGFTLIELVMTILILGILAGVGIPLTGSLIDSMAYSIYRKDLSEQAEVILRRISREMRRLKDSQSVITADGTTYRFVDIDNNTIQFTLNGTDLERELNGQTDILAVGVTAFNLSYLDDQENVITTPSVGVQGTNIKLIDISVTLAAGGSTIYYRTRIRPRNITHLVDLFS